MVAACADALIGLAPQTRQCTVCKLPLYQKLWHKGDALPLQSGVDGKAGMAEAQVSDVFRQQLCPKHLFPGGVAVQKNAQVRYILNIFYCLSILGQRRRRNGYQSNWCKKMVLEACKRWGADPNGQIDAVASEVCQPLSGESCEIQSGVFIQKAGQAGNKPQRGKGRGQAECDTWDLLSYIVYCPIDFIEPTPNLRVKPFRRCGQRETAGKPVEQLNAKFILQSANLLGNCPLCEVELLCSQPEIEVPGRSIKCSEFVEAGVTHRS